MTAAEIKEHPTFALMKQTDVQSIYHTQSPPWLFSDPRYADMRLDAKVSYTFLLNRFQFSRRNGWVNDHGEVFVIFPRKGTGPGAENLRAACDCCVLQAGGAEARLGKAMWPG